MAFVRNKKRRSKANFAPTWKGRLKSIFLPLEPLEEILPNGSSGSRAEWRVNSRPQVGNCAGGGFADPEHSNTEGWRPPLAAGAQNEGAPFRMSLRFVQADRLKAET